MTFKRGQNTKLLLVVSMFLVLVFTVSIGWLCRVSAINKEETYENLKLFNG